MQLKLSYCHLKIKFYNYKLFYVGPMVTTKKIPIEDIQEKNKKKSKYIATQKKSQITKEVNDT